MRNATIVLSVVACFKCGSRLHNLFYFSEKGPIVTAMNRSYSPSTTAFS